MRRTALTVTTLVTFAAGCGQSAKPFAIRDVCSQPAGTNVVVEGFPSLPRSIETIEVSKGGRIADVAYRIPLMADPDASGTSVKVTIWTTADGEPNRMKSMTNGYGLEELTVYAENGDPVTTGKRVRLTGVTEADRNSGCVVNVTKIETP
jgi:hypothetical protein